MAKIEENVFSVSRNVARKSYLVNKISDDSNVTTPSDISQDIINSWLSRFELILGDKTSRDVSKNIAHICNVHESLRSEFRTIELQLSDCEYEKSDIKKAINGHDPVGAVEYCSPLAKEVYKQRGIIEMIKLRLDRLCVNYEQNDLMELRNIILEFLNKPIACVTEPIGNKHE